MFYRYRLGSESINPSLFGYMAVVIETTLAICFLCGIFSNAASIISIIWSLSIWAIPEAFGGPFAAGTNTDIGTAFPYIFISLLLLAVTSGRYYGFDSMLSKKRDRLSFLAVGSKF